MSFEEGQVGDHFILLSTDVKPTTDVPVNSTLLEIDTEDRYKFNQYGRWEFIPPIGLRTKRLGATFIPQRTSGTGVETGAAIIFGDPRWQNIDAEITASGNMIYKIFTLNTEFLTNNSEGALSMNDFARVSLLPKIQVVYKCNSQLTGNCSVFIGICDDAYSPIESTSGNFYSVVAQVGVGWHQSHSNLQVFHNDSVGSRTAIDTGITRTLDVYVIEIEFETATSVRVSIYDVNKVLLYETTLTTEIPDDTKDLAFRAQIVNMNTSTIYAIYLYDFVRLEKNRAVWDSTVDF